VGSSARFRPRLRLFASSLRPLTARNDKAGTPQQGGAPGGRSEPGLVRLLCVPKFGARPEKSPILRRDAIFGTPDAEDAWVQFEAEFGSPPGTSK
jgi:hypothetical protein